MSRHKMIAWNDGHDRLRVSEMYERRPQDGLVFYVEQRTTLSGRAVLLQPEHVRELRDWLTARLAEAEGQPRLPPGGAQSVRESCADAIHLPQSPEVH